MTEKVLEVHENSVLVVLDELVQVVSVMERHPATTGLPDEEDGEEVPYAKRADFVGDTLIYVGHAQPGQAETASTWRIKRLTIGVDGDVTEEWAGGSASFDKVWADRASLSYQ